MLLLVVLLLLGVVVVVGCVVWLLWLWCGVYGGACVVVDVVVVVVIVVVVVEVVVVLVVVAGIHVDGGSPPRVSPPHTYVQVYTVCIYLPSLSLSLSLPSGLCCVVVCGCW